MSKKIFNNKTAKGLVSLITIIILLSSILAGSIYYQSNVTGYFVKKINSEGVDFFSNEIEFKSVDDVNDLNHLNEGFYEIRNGNVLYLESFDSYIPLYIKIINPQQQNGILVVDADGNIEFKEKFNDLVEKQIAVGKDGEIIENENLITGEVTGLERVSGF